ncbi:hypothetical protein V8E54_002514 [Elaphomyces granulatus]
MPAPTIRCWKNLKLLLLRNGGKWKKTGFLFDVNSIAKMLMCAAASRLDVLQLYSNYGSSHAHSSSGYVPLLITQMERDYGVIPATSAPSERVFSVAGNLQLIAKKRT